MSLPEQQAARARRTVNPWVLILGGSVGAVAIIVLVLFVVARLTPERPLGDNERLMPDGTVLKIEGVTWGLIHFVSVDCPPAQPWAFWDDRQVQVYDNQGIQALKIWMTHRDRRSGRLLNFDWWGTSTVTNSLGVEISDYAPTYFIAGQFNGMKSSRRPFRANGPDRDGTWLVNSSFPAFRTDNGKFLLQVKNTSGEVVAKFDLIHPSPPAAKNWQAEELPATKSQGDLMVTLHRLRRDFYSHPGGGKTWYFAPETTVTENGLPTNDWYFGMNLQDAFGNDLSRHVNVTTVSAGEPAWKIQLRGWRREDKEFPASETWTLADVPLPERDFLKPLSDAHTVDGVTIKLVAFAGAGNVSYELPIPATQPSALLTQPISAFDSPVNIQSGVDGSPNKIQMEANWPHVVFEVAAENYQHYLLIKARDNLNREVPTQPFTYGLSPNLRAFFFKAEPDAKSLTLTFIVRNAREFEFFVKPPEFSEEKPKP